MKYFSLLLALTLTFFFVCEDSKEVSREFEINSNFFKSDYVSRTVEFQHSPFSELKSNNLDQYIWIEETVESARLREEIITTLF